jgi:hypothetical protein
MKKTILYILSLFVFASTTRAQHHYQKNLFAAAWEIGFPVSNNNFLSKTSYEGGKIEYRGFIKENLSIGGFLNWRSYYEYFPTKTYENSDKTQAVTTDMYRYIYNLPMGATVHYYFKGTKMLQPFAGLGLGAQYSEQTAYYNIYYSQEKNWGFLVRPEIGTLIHMEGQWGFIFGASYAYSTNKNKIGLNGLADVNIQIGFIFTD